QLDGRVVRVRIRLRHETRGRVLPRGLSRQPRRAVGDLRPRRRLHRRFPVPRTPCPARAIASRRMTTRTTEEARSLILYAIVMTALTAILIWCAYIVRDALLIVYVSVLFSLGFSPIVRMIERQKVLPIAKRLPRWLAILILYLAILG